MGADQSCCSQRENKQSDTRSISKNPRKEAPPPTRMPVPQNDEQVPSASLEKVGIGAYFQRSADDPNGLAVKSLLKGSPAQACGKISIGDVVLEVDGDKVYGKKLAELAEVLLGPAKSEVKLKFRSKSSGKEFMVSLQRGIPGNA